MSPLDGSNHRIASGRYGGSSSLTYIGTANTTPSHSSLIAQCVSRGAIDELDAKPEVRAKRADVRIVVDELRDALDLEGEVVRQRAADLVAGAVAEFVRAGRGAADGAVDREGV